MKQMGATEFVKKPGSGLSFQDVVQKLNLRWLAPATVAPAPAEGFVEI